MSPIAKTPKPPYYAVIFTSDLTDGDNGYREMAAKKVELASVQPGFLGVESAREDKGTRFHTGLISNPSKPGR